MSEDKKRSLFKRQFLQETLYVFWKQQLQYQCIEVSSALIVFYQNDLQQKERAPTLFEFYFQI